MARQTLNENRKYKLLVRHLGMAKAHVRGHLETLWDVANASGDPVIGSPDHVEAAAEWDGDPGVFFQALKDDHWIEEVEPGRWAIHDYWDHCPEYVKKRRLREKEREERGEAMERRTASTNGRRSADNGGQDRPVVAEGRTSADNGKPPAPTPTPRIESSPSAHSLGASENADDGAWMEGFERIWSAAHASMKECGEVSAQQACFFALRHDTLRIDGSPPPARGKSRTISEAVACLAAWERTRRWQDGFRPHLDKFLRQAVFLVDPPPEPVKLDDRRGAGAHQDAQPSRVKRVMGGVE